MKSHAANPARVAWILNILGWLTILSGGGWDIIYHLAPLVGVHWSPFIDFLGEFGHTIVFFGMFTVVLGLLLKRAK